LPAKEEIMYVILGATGNTGSVVANTLLEKGKKVRVVGRDARKLATCVSRGAEAFVGDVVDADALSRAFAGAEGVYSLIPPDTTSDDYRRYQDQVSDAVATAIEACGVKYVVTLSSIGAEQEAGTGAVLGPHYMESRFADIPEINILHLRAGYFMENILPQIGIIHSFGMMAGPVRADLPLPMIATKDIGAAAADALLHFNFTGVQKQELLGPRDISYGEVARIVGMVIGRPALAYVQMGSEQIVQALTAMGISRNVAGLICEMSDALNSGRMRALEPRSEKSSTPTSFETFVQDVFLPAYKGQAASA
jgi:uncharacterized protein YbjT (DUF2867 family)